MLYANAEIQRERERLRKHNLIINQRLHVPDCQHCGDEHWLLAGKLAACADEIYVGEGEAYDMHEIHCPTTNQLLLRWCAGLKIYPHRELYGDDPAIWQGDGI